MPGRGWALEAGQSPCCCLASLHLTAPRTAALCAPVSCILPLPRRMKTLPETSNSSVPLPLHGALLQAHFEGKKKAEKPLFCPSSPELPFKRE